MDNQKKPGQQPNIPNKTGQSGQSQPSHSPEHKKTGGAHDMQHQSGNKSGNPFDGLDYNKMDEFSRRLESDADLKRRFEEDAESVLEDEGIELPEGIKATYEKQFKGGENPRYSKRFGHIRLAKE